MAKIKKNEKRMLIVLGVIVVIGAIDFAIEPETYLGYYRSNKTAELSSNTTQVKAPALSNKPESKLSELTSWGRDPFYNSKRVVKRKSVTPKVVVQTVNLVLKAVSMSSNNSVAMINNNILGGGEEIEGYTVQRIQPKEVVLMKNGQTKTLTLK